MSTLKSILSLGVLAVALSSCSTIHSSGKPTPSSTSSAPQMQAGENGIVVVPFELQVELKGKDGTYCIEGFTRNGERQPKVINFTRGLSFTKGAKSSPPPANFDEWSDNVSFWSKAPVEVTDCKGKTLQKTEMDVDISFYDEDEEGIQPVINLDISMEGIGSYDLDVFLESSGKIVEAFPSKPGAYPVTQASVRVKLEIPKETGKPAQAYSFNGVMDLGSAK